MEIVLMDSNKRKGGRPKKDNKREIVTGVRFNKSEYHIIKCKAKTAGLKLTNYIRLMALEGSVKQRLEDVEKQQLKQLIGMANNINQMAKIANRDGFLKAHLYFENSREQLDRILNQFQHDK